MGLCLIYGVALTFSLPKIHKIKYIIFRSSCRKGCSVCGAHAGWSRLFQKDIECCEKPLSPHKWQESDIESWFENSWRLGQTKDNFLVSWWMNFCWFEFLLWNLMIAGSVDTLVDALFLSHLPFTVCQISTAPCWWLTDWSEGTLTQELSFQPQSKMHQ